MLWLLPFISAACPLLTASNRPVLNAESFHAAERIRGVRHLRPVLLYSAVMICDFPQIQGGPQIPSETNLWASMNLREVIPWFSPKMTT